MGDETPEGVKRGGERLMVAGVVAGWLIAAFVAIPAGLVIGGAVFALGALKWHAGLSR